MRGGIKELPSESGTAAHNAGRVGGEEGMSEGVPHIRNAATFDDKVFPVDGRGEPLGVPKSKARLHLLL